MLLRNAVTLRLTSIKAVVAARETSWSHTCKATATGGESLGVPPSHDSKREVTVDE